MVVVVLLLVRLAELWSGIMARFQWPCASTGDAAKCAPSRFANDTSGIDMLLPLLSLPMELINGYSYKDCGCTVVVVVVVVTVEAADDDDDEDCFICLGKIHCRKIPSSCHEYTTTTDVDGSEGAVVRLRTAVMS